MKVLNLIRPVLFALLATASSGLLSQPAFAEQEGGTHSGGGGGMKASLEGLLPKRIHQQFVFDLRGAVDARSALAFKPLVSKSRCKLFFTCYQAPEEVTVDIGYKVTPTQIRGYEVESYRMRYLRKGKIYELKTEVPAGQSFMDEIYDHYLFHVAGFKRRDSFETIYEYRKPSVADWREMFTTEDDKVQATGGLKPYLAIPGHVTQLIWVDGKLSSSRALRTELDRIQGVLIGQADLNDSNDAEEALTQAAQLQRMNEYFGRDQLVIGPLQTPSSHFIARMESGARALLEFGQSAVSSDGTCDPTRYSQLLNQLEAWKIGSPAYFYEAGSLPWIDKDAQFTAIGIRQKLRADVKKSVAKYCEPQSATSRVDLVLND